MLSRLSRFSRWFSRDQLHGKPPVGSLLVLVLRGGFGVLMVLMAWVAFSYFDSVRKDFVTAILTSLGILVTGGVVVTLDLIVRNKQITTISAVYFGLLLGLLLGTIFSAA